MRVREMKKLGQAQAYGIIGMLFGFSVYLLAAILVPQQILLWVLGWATALIGAGVYAVATAPSAVAWLLRLIRHRKR